jgi:hypothetical protein
VAGNSLRRKVNILIDQLHHAIPHPNIYTAPHHIPGQTTPNYTISYHTILGFIFIHVIAFLILISNLPVDSIPMQEVHFPVYPLLH